MSEKICVICNDVNATSDQIFEVEFKDGEKISYCVVCLSEGPLSEVPEDIKTIKNITEGKKKMVEKQCEWCESAYHLSNEPHHGKPAYFCVSLRNNSKFVKSVNPFNHRILCGDCLHSWMRHGEPIVFAYKLINVRWATIELKKNEKGLYYETSFSQYFNSEVLNKKKVSFNDLETLIKSTESFIEEQTRTCEAN